MTASYDVIIVGAQTGGSAAGIALAKKGLRVALLDSKKYEKIGEKVCGDATSPHYFERIKNEFGIPIEPPHSTEIRQEIEGFYFISPDRKSKLQLDLPGGYIIDRFAFVRTDPAKLASRRSWLLRFHPERSFSSRLSPRKLFSA